MPEATFKPYQQNQLRLLPLDLSEMIPSDHMVRVVDEIVESLDLSQLKALYPGGGAPAYDPRMMLKVIIFAYASGIYSSRKIAEATRSSIYFLWLTGCVYLDHMTINRFRTNRLCGVFEDIFTDTVLLLAKYNLISLNTYFLDGTKIEANANPYTFTWKKSVETRREKLRARIGELMGQIDALNDEEDKAYEDMPDPQEINSEDLVKLKQRIDERLAKTPENKELKRQAKQIEKDYLPRLISYESDLADIGNDRNSLSKTDRDATFMRMKEDHMGNGQLKAAYNIQNGTENQFVIHTTIHQRPGDTACMRPHLHSLEKAFGYLPERIVADAGYGSEENYEQLKQKGVQAYVKYNTFHKEQKKAFKNDPTQPVNWQYSSEKDEYTCANNKVLSFAYEKKATSDLGYESITRVYRSSDCGGCPYAQKCLRKDAKSRNIYVNKHLEGLRKSAAELLTSEEGIKLRRRRATDVETVFGDIKRNWNFRRFSLRGLSKVAHEWRLLMMGHNIRKLTRAIRPTMMPALS